MRRRSWHHNSDLKADKRAFYRILSQPGQTTVTPVRLSSLGGQVLQLAVWWDVTLLIAGTVVTKTITKLTRSAKSSRQVLGKGSWANPCNQTATN